MASSTNCEYERYLKIKAVCEGKYFNSVPVDMLSAFFIADIVYNFSGRSLLGKIKFLIKSLFVPKVKPPSAQAYSLFGWSIDRENYHRLSDAYQRELGGKFDSICFSGRGGWKFFISSAALLTSLKIALSAKELGVFDRVILAFSIFQSSNFLEYISRLDFSGCRRYLSFNSSYSYESVFTLSMRSKGVVTYGMQHGIYYKFKGYIPFEMIGMYFSTAEKFLGWGDFSVNQIGGFLRPFTEPVVFGNPIYRGKKVQSCFDKRSNEVLVFLPRVTYAKELRKLIELLSLDVFSNYSIIIRPHPSLDTAELATICASKSNFKISTNKNLEEDFSCSVLAAIGFNTTTLFESIFFGVPIAQFICGNDEFINVGFFEFNKPDELLIYLESLTREKFIQLDPGPYFG